jgi:hypothetical protein
LTIVVSGSGFCPTISGGKRLVCEYETDATNTREIQSGRSKKFFIARGTKNYLKYVPRPFTASAAFAIVYIRERSGIGVSLEEKILQHPEHMFH